MSLSSDLQKFVQNGMAAQDAANNAIRARPTEPEISHEGAKVAKSVNPTTLLCRSAVRSFLLDAARQHRPFNKFSRVSEDTLIAANSMLRQWLISRVKCAPSKGVTL